MSNQFDDMCDIPWWDRLKTKEEKDAYCQSHYGMSFEEWKDSLNYDYRYDSETRKWVRIE